MRAAHLLLTGIMAAASVFAAPSSFADTQETIAVKLDGGTANAAKLKPYDNAFVVTQRVSDGRVIEAGIWTDQLRLRDVKGQKLWVRTQSIGYFDGRVMNSVNTFDSKTFAPVSNIQVNPDGSKEQWSFSPTSAEGHLTDASGHQSVVTVPFRNPSFDLNCCMRSLLPAALPLAKGREFVIPVVPAQGDPEVVMEKVVGRERIQAGYRGMLDAWVVETPVPGGGTVRFWIAETPPFLVHMTLIGTPGKGGIPYDQFFDMVG